MPTHERVFSDVADTLILGSCMLLTLVVVTYRILEATKIAQMQGWPRWFRFRVRSLVYPVLNGVLWLVRSHDVDCLHGEFLA